MTRRSWLRLLVFAIRVVVGIIVLGTAILGGTLSAAAFGRDSPLVWTIALLAGLGAGVALMSNPAIHRVVDQLERRIVQGDSQVDPPRQGV